MQSTDDNLAIELDKIEEIKKKNRIKNTRVYQRIFNLLDSDSTWLELSSIAGYDNDTDKNIPSGNIICGIGQINKSHVMVMANNPDFKAGCYFPITIKKQLRAQNIAINLKLPCVYLAESAGLYLPLQEQAFANQNGFGKIFFNQSQLYKKNIYQIAIVFGPCIAGGAYIPAMTDEMIMINNQAKIYLAGPKLVNAAIGEIADDDNLGGTTMHSCKSGVNDYTAENEKHAYEICKNLLPRKKHANSTYNYSINKSIYQTIPNNPTVPVDCMQLIEKIVDKDSFVEFKANYANTIICGFAKINDFNIAIIANNGVLLSTSAKKTAQFVRNANKKSTTLLFIQNINGFMVGTKAEQSGILRYGAELIKTISCSKLKKITLMINNSYGAGNYAMCGRAFEPDFLWSWPNAKTAVMGGEQVFKVLQTIKNNSNENKEHFINSYNYQSSTLFSSANLWDDNIIDPALTREKLTLSLIAINHYEEY